MSSLGSLVVSLSANTAQFTSDMGKAAHLSAKRMEDMKKSAEMAGKAIGTMFVAGVGAAAILVKQSIDSADEMGKMAQKAGVSIEAFSGMAYAADLAGVQSGALQASMSKLGATLADVARGAGADSEAAFKALGMSVKDSEGKLKNADVIMMEVAAKFATMEDGAGKTALAIKIFGRSGAELIPLLNSGADGIREMREEAKALGAEMDGPTKNAAEAFNDNLTRLNYVKKGLANQIMKAVLPSLQGLTDHMIDSAKASGGLADAAQVAATGMKILMSGGVIMAGVFNTLGQIIGGVAATIAQFAQGNFAAAFETATQTVEDYANNIGKTVGTVGAIWDDAAKKAESGAPAVGKKIATPLMAGAKAVETEAEKIKKKIDDMIANLQLQYEMMGKTAKESELLKLAKEGAGEDALKEASMILTLTEAKKKEIDMMEEAAKVYENMRTPLESYNVTLENLGTLLQARAIDMETYSRAIIKAQDDFDKLTDKNKEMDELTKSVQGWGKQFTDTFVDGVMKGKLSFKDLADSIIADILRIIVQKQVLSALGDFGGGGKAGTGILGAIGSVAASFDGGGYTGTGSRSGGLDGKGGFMAMLHPQETVTDHTKGQSVGGGTQITFAPVYQIDARADRMAVQQDMQRISRQANADLVEKLQRQGRI